MSDSRDSTAASLEVAAEPLDRLDRYAAAIVPRSEDVVSAHSDPILDNFYAQLASLTAEVGAFSEWERLTRERDHPRPATPAFSSTVVLETNRPPVLHYSNSVTAWPGHGRKIAGTGRFVLARLGTKCYISRETRSNPRKSSSMTDPSAPPLSRPGRFHPPPAELNSGDITGWKYGRICSAAPCCPPLGPHRHARHPP
jgi:hypothetical protein